MFTRLWRRHQMLVPILQPADRLAGFQCDRANDDFLRHQPRLAAKAAADIGRDDAQLMGRQIQILGECGAHEMRDLGREMNHQLT